MENWNYVYVEGRATKVEKQEKELRGIIEVERTSGKVDQIPFRSTSLDIEEGNWIGFTGILATENTRDQAGLSHKKMFVLGRRVLHTKGKFCNEVEFNGVLVRKDVIRRTPLGRVVMDIVLAINGDNRRSQYPSAIVWESVAERANDLSIGTSVYVQGRFQSREYRKMTTTGVVEDRTAYEISINSFEVLGD